MSKLTYTEDELMAEHDYAEPHVIAGRRMHGGFLADGTYVPPRTKIRGAAIDAWTAALRDRGGDLFDAHASLLDGQRLPNVEQSRILLRNDLGESFWNTLTIIGKIEAKGRLLADITFPLLQPVIVEDISEMAIGHLNEGLLVAHGLDEGGLPDAGHRRPRRDVVRRPRPRVRRRRLSRRRAAREHRPRRRRTSDPRALPRDRRARLVPRQPPAHRVPRRARLLGEPGHSPHTRPLSPAAAPRPRKRPRSSVASESTKRSTSPRCACTWVRSARARSRRSTAAPSPAPR